MIQVDPRSLAFIINLLFRTSIWIHLIKFQVILIPVHPLHHEIFTIESPVRLAEILIILFIEIRPGHLSAIQLNDTHFHLRVRIACFRITCFL
ncbi:hypothetical protein D3C81_1280290 [compost metagenome]